MGRRAVPAAVLAGLVLATALVPGVSAAKGQPRWKTNQRAAPEATAAPLPGPLVCRDGTPAASPAPSADPFASPLPPASPAVADPVVSPAPATSPDPAASPAAGASPAPDPSAAPPTADVPSCPPGASNFDWGTDDRLTVLLVGTDYRRQVSGERTDVIMVMSLDRTTKRIVAASIPRDLAKFPRAPRNGGGTSGLMRVNGLYTIYRKDSMPHERIDRKAMARFKDDVAYALGAEIDYWAAIRFKQFAGLVDRIGGVEVDIPEPIDDPEFHRDGAFFPAATGYHLDAGSECKRPKPCHNVLTYARSRKGSVGSGPNSDYARARRQQELVVAASQTGVRRGFTLKDLATLLPLVQSKMPTDIPITPAAAIELLALANGATMAPRDTAVFGPRQWAETTPDLPVYAYAMKLDEVRAWIDERFNRGRER